MRRFRLLALLSLLALSATGVLAHPAAAIEPTRVPIDDTVITEVTDICSFPVTITATIVGTETTFYDQNGEVTRQQIHIVEQDGGVLRLVEKGTDAGSGWRILRGGGDGLVDHLPNSRRVGELTA